MPYPTIVTEPRVGTDAFAANDAASQLAQAAYLLLLGQELRRGRERLAIAPGFETRQESPDADTALFGIPRIETAGRRYRIREALAAETGSSKRPRVSDPDEMLRISSDLALRLRESPREQTAAALLEACTLRVEPVVRVAAAAAGMELTAKPSRLIAILAKATRDDDPLVRDLAATALARAYPEHPALRRLTARARLPAKKDKAHTSLLVHGTFARNAGWWQPGGDFHVYLLANVLPDLYGGADRFEWSGGYSDAARLLAASDLQAWIASHDLEGPLVMGHSHGANVALLATQLGVTMSKAVLLSCPVHWSKYAPDFSHAAKLVSIRVHLDLVILADGGGQRFDDPRIEENVLPLWFNHSATHDPAVWQAHGVPGLL